MAGAAFKQAVQPMADAAKAVVGAAASKPAAAPTARKAPPRKSAAKKSAAKRSALSAATPGPTAVAGTADASLHHRPRHAPRLAHGAGTGSCTGRCPTPDARRHFHPGSGVFHRCLCAACAGAARRAAGALARLVVGRLRGRGRGRQRRGVLRRACAGADAVRPGRAATSKCSPARTRSRASSPTPRWCMPMRPRPTSPS